jgi:hypothetical protein
LSPWRRAAGFDEAGDRDSRVTWASTACPWS